MADLKAADIENILALRGDLPADGKTQGDFQYASDLVSEIKRDGDFNILGACYPDVHPEAKDSVDDIKNLKCKVDAGVSQLITQLFFENEHYYQFLERCELADIDVPVQAGIMSVVNERQIKRMATMNGVGLLQKFLEWWIIIRITRWRWGCRNGLCDRPDCGLIVRGCGWCTSIYHG